MPLTRSVKAKASRQSADDTDARTSEQTSTLSTAGAPQGIKMTTMPSSRSTATHSRGVTTGAKHTQAPASSTLGATQGPTLTGPSSQPTRQPTILQGTPATVTPATAFLTGLSTVSPTGTNSGVRQHQVRLTAASTPTNTDAATDSAASARHLQPPPVLAAHIARRGTHPAQTTGPSSLFTLTSSQVRCATAERSSRRSSQRSMRLLQLAQAKEEQARLNVELAAARIATLEAQQRLDDDEDARTTLTDDETEKSTVEAHSPQSTVEAHSPLHTDEATTTTLLISIHSLPEVPFRSRPHKRVLLLQRKFHRPEQFTNTT